MDNLSLDSILQVSMIVLAVASAAVPLARKLASLTASRADDEWVEKVANIIDKALSWIPTVTVKPKK